MTKQQKDQIVAWAKAEYDRRTKLIEGGHGRDEWIEPSTRVSLTEVRSYADGIGITMGVNDVADFLKEMNAAA